MADIALLLFDFEPPEKIPGFLPHSSSGGFPIWGEYCFLDIALVNTSFPSINKRYLFTRRELSRLIIPHAARWKDFEITFLALETELTEFKERLKGIHADRFILYSLGFVGYIETGSFEKLADSTPTDKIIKISINDIPVELYISGKKKLLAAIENLKPAINKKPFFTKSLFTEIFNPAVDKPVNLKGKVIFHNNILQLHRANLMLLKHEDIHELFSRLKSLSPLKEKETLISQKGWVKNSVLSSGVRIDGYVENSVIFSGVHIREEASVINSVVMNNNQIGERARVSNAIIFPGIDEGTTVLSIGEDVVIGGGSNVIKNKDFPQQIKDGLTVIGMHPSIPNNTVVEAGCFIGPDIPAGFYKGIPRIKKGTSLIGSP
ncbi:MAG: hypothetical protein AB1798_12075 [Spirochaetota bacterium]